MKAGRQRSFRVPHPSLRHAQYLFDQLANGIWSEVVGLPFGHYNDVYRKLQGD